MRLKIVGLVCLLGLCCLGVGFAQVADSASGQHDAHIQVEVVRTLHAKRFKEVTVAVHDGIVTLSGTVQIYSAKEDASRRAHRRKFVRGVENLIQVAGPTVDDETLRNKLAEKIAYDRVGYGTTAFNAFTIGVKDGVVTLGGVAYGPVDKDSAVSLVSNYPGVKGVEDKVAVAPLSPMDDRIRLEEARAIYGAPQLNRYAIDPAKPIRITVIHGDVTLTGVVNSVGDKDVAYVRASSVPGVFKVINLLQVAGAAPEK